MAILWLISLAIMLVGLVGTVVPAIPGMPLILLGLAIFSIGTGFSVISLPEFVGLALLGLAGFGLHYLGNIFGARKFGASRWGLLGAVLGLVGGLILLNPFALVLGPIVGAIGLELLSGRDLRASVRSGIGTFIGYVLGSLVEVIIALVIVGWFVVRTFGAVTGRAVPLPGAI